jgi:hypothetical protein
MMTIILLMEAEAAGISETSVYFYWTTPRNIPEGFRLYTPSRENLKSYLKLWMVVPQLASHRGNPGTITRDFK